MNISEFFLFEDISLFVYAVFKAFLPLPSLEVILIPICMKTPEKWLYYSVIGSIGTWIGGTIGYIIAGYTKDTLLIKIISEKDLIKSKELMNKYGVIAVFIGGITPIPDFILPYVAGLTNMNYLLFSLADSIARLLRSMLVCYSLLYFGRILNLEKYGYMISLGIIICLFLKWLISYLRKDIK